MTELISFGSAVSAVGDFDAFVKFAHQQPILTEQEELRCALAWTEQQCQRSAEKLVLSHLRLVLSMAHQYVGYGLPYADIAQEGVIGLMKAVHRFKPSKGVRLCTYAAHWIRAHISEYVLANWRIVRTVATKAQRKLFFKLKSLRSDAAFLHADEAGAIAAQLGVSQADVLEMDTRLHGCDVSLDSPIGEDGGDTWVDALVADSDAGDPQVTVLAAEDEQRRAVALNEALAGLDSRSRYVVQARWLCADEERKTLHELGAELGVSYERVRQIEAAALRKMRVAFAERT